MGAVHKRPKTVIFSHAGAFFGPIITDTRNNLIPDEEFDR